jgi:hypothetical protein
MFIPHHLEVEGKGGWGWNLISFEFAEGMRVYVRKNLYSYLHVSSFY